jgi:hypothetical protein
MFTIAVALLFIAPMITPAFAATQIESQASYYEIPILSKVQDAYSSEAGISLDFSRTNFQNSQNTPYLGPFGRGWTYSYNLFLEENPAGRILFFWARWFHSMVPT